MAFAASFSRRLAAGFVALSLGWSLAPAAWAGAGDLDPSFSGDGKLTTDFGVGGASGVALQGDGKIVAVGDSGGDFALARYNPDGSLDPSFAGDGMQTTDFGRDFEGASDVALQPEGKIVVVGGGGPGGDFALARYNPDGSLDSSFAGDGMQTTDFGERRRGLGRRASGRWQGRGRGNNRGSRLNRLRARALQPGRLARSRASRVTACRPRISAPPTAPRPSRSRPTAGSSSRGQPAA